MSNSSPPNGFRPRVVQSALEARGVVLDSARQDPRAYLAGLSAVSRVRAGGALGRAGLQGLGEDENEGWAYPEDSSPAPPSGSDYGPPAPEGSPTVDGPTQDEADGWDMIAEWGKKAWDWISSNPDKVAGVVSSLSKLDLTNASATAGATIPKEPREARLAAIGVLYDRYWTGQGRVFTPVEAAAQTVKVYDANVFKNGKPAVSVASTLGTISRFPPAAPKPNAAPAAGGAVAPRTSSGKRLGSSTFLTAIAAGRGIPTFAERMAFLGKGGGKVKRIVGQNKVITGIVQADGTVTPTSTASSGMGKALLVGAGLFIAKFVLRIF